MQYFACHKIYWQRKQKRKLCQKLQIYHYHWGVRFVLCRTNLKVEANKVLPISKLWRRTYTFIVPNLEERNKLIMLFFQPNFGPNKFLKIGNCFHMTVIDDVLFLKFLNDDPILINKSEKLCSLNGVGLNETSYGSEFVHLMLHFYGWLATTIISKTQLPDLLRHLLKALCLQERSMAVA